MRFRPFTLSAPALLGHLALVGALLGASPARAERAFVVSLNHCNEVSSGEPARDMRDALERRPGLEVMGEEETAQALGGSSSGSLDEAERMQQAAHLDLIGANFARADRTLNTAEALFMRLRPSAERWVSYRDALTTHVWVNMRMERRNEAEHEAREILAVEPEFLPSERIYPPAVTKFFLGVRAHLKKEPRYTLEVHNEPGVPVFVGLKPVGKGSVRVQLPAGSYQLEGGYEARGLPHQVRVDSPTQFTLSKVFDGAVWPERGPCFSLGSDRGARLRFLTQVAAIANAQRAVALELEEPAPGERYVVTSVVEASTGQEVRVAKVKLGTTKLLSTAVAELADFVTTGRAPGAVEVLQSAPGSESAEPQASDASSTTPANVPAREPPATAPNLSPKPAESASRPGLVEHKDLANRGTSPLRIASYVALSAAVVSAGFGVYELSRKNAALSDFDRDYAQAQTGDAAALARAQDDSSRAKSASNLETAGLVAGGGLAVTGMVLFLVSRPSDAVQATAAIVDGRPGVIVAGKF